MNTLKLEEFVQTIPDIIYEIDPQGRFTFVNNAVRQLGYSPQELIGKHFREIIHPDDFKRVSRGMILSRYKGKKTGNAGSPKLFDERRTGARMTKNCELRVALKGKKAISSDYHDATMYSLGYHYGMVHSTGKWANPVTEKHKKFIGTMGIIRDITEQKKAEKKQVNALAEAIKIDQKRAAELEKSYYELQQSKDQLVQSEKLAFAGRMAASVAHEIRNPLNMMVMSIQLLQQELPKKDPRREMADIIMRNLTRIERLVTELVNCARPPRLKMTNANIHMIMNSVINTIKEKCNTQKIKIVKNFNSRIPRIRLDKERIEETILNIAKNSIESMPKGGTLTLSTDWDSDSVNIDIVDTGSGIPEKDMIRIFDPFFTTKKSGTGLGLAVSYAIISGHNGFINLESKKGRTSFTIELPI